MVVLVSLFYWLSWLVMVSMENNLCPPFVISVLLKSTIVI